MSLYEIISLAIESYENDLNNIGKEIWRQPELKFEEHFAHELLTDFLEKHGFEVQRGYFLPTAFRAEFTSKNGSTGPVIAVLCEYDALPGIGHACGHNLIAQCGVAAGLCIKTVLESDLNIPGKVVVMGTPAEEGGGGKILLLKNGAFKGVDVAMMAHPSKRDCCTIKNNLCLPITVTYKGKSTHAAGTPWEGKNALDAAVSCYVNASLLRQQIKPEWCINVIISNGGEATNVIPKESQLKLMLRTSNMADMEELKKKMNACFEAAALATDCEMEAVFHDDRFYKEFIPNRILEELYLKHMTSLGVNVEKNAVPSRVSTDQGNVSYELPAMHPNFQITEEVTTHSTEFAEVAGRPESRAKANIVAKALAMTAVDLFDNPDLLADVKKFFQSVKPM